jgi:hypothetical protein
MRLLATDLGPGKVPAANDLSSGREVLKASGGLALRAAMHRPRTVRGILPLRSHVITLKPSTGNLAARPGRKQHTSDRKTNDRRFFICGDIGGVMRRVRSSGGTPARNNDETGCNR